MACVNVQNEDDNKCLVWAIRSALDEKEIPHTPQYVDHYIPNEHKDLNMAGITFPVHIDQFDKIEKQNEGLTLNLYGYRLTKNGKHHSIFPIRIVDNPGARHINLLYLSNEQEAKSHYVWIKNLGALINHQYNRHNGRRHLCPRCLSNFNSPKMLAHHDKHCREERAQRTIYPKQDSKLNYSKVGNQHVIPFFAVGDIESVLRPIPPPATVDAPAEIADSPTSTTSRTSQATSPQAPSTTPIADHIPCAAQYMIVSTDPRFGPGWRRTFEGEGCVEQFIDALQHDARRVTKLLDVNVPHGLSLAEVRGRNAAATCCYLCKGPR